MRRIVDHETQEHQEKTHRSTAIRQMFDRLDDPKLNHKLWNMEDTDEDEATRELARRAAKRIGTE
jgi:hypothetical protein